MLTLPEVRRQGAARALLHALAASAQAESMRELYLLVDRDNTPARALYQSAGFVDRFEYHYRKQPDPTAVRTPDCEARLTAALARGR